MLYLIFIKEQIYYFKINIIKYSMESLKILLIVFKIGDRKEIYENLLHFNDY